MGKSRTETVSGGENETKTLQHNHFLQVLI